MKRIVDFFQNIPSEIQISKREFFLTIAVAALGGIVFGMICSPRKNQSFGCNNGNGWSIPREDEEDEDFFDED